ncbi:UCH domain-containing protein [Aphis craccivora]|uniref:UCH domain-containing protein n=1 Tax=Aphis craccivora TaxID=307492 RepID=A0A6G0XER5_APHCR|nr:UCH domain-containing protein [Aphis craccivora]
MEEESFFILMDGYLYYKHSENKGRFYWCCRKKQPICNDLQGRCRNLQTDISSVKCVSAFISSQRSSEAATLLKVKLCDIPQILVHETTRYELRRVICFYRGKGNLRRSVGHYTSYTKRYDRNWELFDDLKKNTPIPVKDTTTVDCEFLVYTV